MKNSQLLVLALCLMHCCSHAQSYKGFFIGLNQSKILNDDRFKGGRTGWHLGYALRGDVKKNAFLQLELLASMEGGSAKDSDTRAVLRYLKAPVLVNVLLDQKSPLRVVLGVQPSFYMGGNTKMHRPIYRPKLWKADDCKYVQEGLSIKYDNNLQTQPKNWNLEAAIGFEILRKKMNYGVRATIAALNQNRFQTSTIGLRVGF
ncbi:MAG: hypothetical protein GC192_00455 [Bacteroidetes bacterium]|nr:hypothetical protein [Bacteroidota bacterium]